MKIRWFLTTAFLVIVVIGAALYLTKQPIVFSRPFAAPLIDENYLQLVVRTLSERFIPRDAHHPAVLAVAGDYIESEFRKSSERVLRQEFLRKGDIYSNVSAFFGPAEGARIVVGAHYDSVGTDSSGNYVPGADDNASGVAGLLGLAQLFADYSPRVPVELVAFANEEQPSFGTEFMGSAVHARDLRQRGKDVSLMIDLEMIGYFSDVPNSQRYHLWIFRRLYPTTADFIALVGRWNEWGDLLSLKSAMVGATALPVLSVSIPYELPRLADSDHISFWREGFPAIMVTDTSFNRNRNYHGTHDTWQTLDYHRMGQVIQGVFAYIASRESSQDAVQPPKKMGRTSSVQ